MISFYPGPSRVYDEIPVYVKDAYRDGLLSMNHRSPEFINLSRKTISLLKSKLNVPRNFTVFFASSATECWEIIEQSLVTRQSIHIFNGAFGEKWFDYARRLRPKSMAFPFDPEELPDMEKMKFLSGELICLTQNETSNGTQISNEMIAAFKKLNPNHLIAVDATSSMAGIQLGFINADIWFASVQKCFGLPAGLGVMIVSPRGMEAIARINESSHYNSLTLMANRMAKWQTSCTPNVLGIYLLMRTLQKRQSMRVVEREIKARAAAWNSFFNKSKLMTLLIRNPSTRSFTVMAVKSDPERIQKIKTAAAKKGLLLGEGYGTLNKETFRIANFPALQGREIAALKRFLTPYL